MANSFYNVTGNPVTGSFGASATIRSEFAAIAAGFDKLPALTANKAVIINALGTAMTVTTGSLALAGDFSTTGAFSTQLVQQANTVLTLPSATGQLITRTSTDTLTNKTLTAPVMTTPVLGVATATSLAIGGVAIGSNALAVTGTTALAAVAASVLALGGATIGADTLAVAGTSTFSGNVTSTSGNFIVGASNYFRWSASTLINAPSDGILKLSNAANADFSRLQLGGTTSAFPAIKRVGAGLAFRVGDDSADAGISASTGTFTGALTYGGVTLSNSVTGTGSMVLSSAPSLTNPDVTTQAAGNNTTKAASTAFVTALVSAGLWAAAAGTANALTGAYTPAVTALTDGMVLGFRAASNITSTTPTYKADGTTARTIVRDDGKALDGTEIVAAGEYFIRYNLANTRWELLNPSPNKAVGFIANRNGVNQTLTAGVATKIQFNNVLRNDGSYYDGVTNFRFTPPPGVYRVLLLTGQSSGSLNECPQPIIYKNGVGIAEGQYFPVNALGSSLTARLAVLTDVACNGTDYIEFYQYSPAAGSATLNGSTIYTQASAYKIRDL